MPDGQQNSSVSAPGSVETPKYIVPGLQRGLEILRTFSRDRYSIGAPELARELNIPRSTVFRLIQTLEYMGFLEKLENGSEYRLSVGVLSLGFEFIASLEVTDLARPLLEKLRDETGHSVHLAIRDGGGNGSIIGRNTFQRPKEEALAMLDHIIKIYQNKA